jgi:hypothetical protein
MSRSVGRNTPLSDSEIKACEPRQWSAISWSVKSCVFRELSVF